MRTCATPLSSRLWNCHVLPSGWCRSEPRPGMGPILPPSTSVGSHVSGRGSLGEEFWPETQHRCKHCPTQMLRCRCRAARSSSRTRVHISEGCSRQKSREFRLPGAVTDAVAALSSRNTCWLLSGICLFIPCEFMARNRALDLNAGENSPPQAKTCHSSQGTHGIWKTAKVQGKYSECQGWSRGLGAGCALRPLRVYPCVLGCLHSLRPGSEKLAVGPGPACGLSKSLSRQTSLGVGFFLPPILSSCTSRSRHPTCPRLTEATSL